MHIQYSISDCYHPSLPVTGIPYCLNDATFGRPQAARQASPIWTLDVSDYLRLGVLLVSLRCPEDDWRCRNSMFDWKTR